MDTQPDAPHPAAPADATPPGAVVVPPEKKTSKAFVWTAERKAFCRLYVQTHNAAEAYIQSHDPTGPDGQELPYQTLAKRGERLLRHPAIQGDIWSREAPFWRKFPLTPDTILAAAAKVAFSNMGDYFDFTGDVVTLKKANRIGRHAQAAIQQMKVKTRRVKKHVGADAAGNPVYQETVTQTVDLKLHPKTKALEALARVLGIGSPRDVLTELIEALPLELRAKVSGIVLAAIEAKEDRSPRVVAASAN